MKPGNFESMLVVVSGDARARLEKAAVDRPAAAVRSCKAVEGAPTLARERAARCLLNAEAVASEFGALGKEC